MKHIPFKLSGSRTKGASSRLREHLGVCSLNGIRDHQLRTPQGNGCAVTFHCRQGDFLQRFQTSRYGMAIVAFLNPRQSGSGGTIASNDERNPQMMPLLTHASECVRSLHRFSHSAPQVFQFPANCCLAQGCCHFAAIIRGPAKDQNQTFLTFCHALIKLMSFRNKTFSPLTYGPSRSVCLGFILRS